MTEILVSIRTIYPAAVYSPLVPESGDRYTWLFASCRVLRLGIDT